jgi:hypothetical protein
MICPRCDSEYVEGVAECPQCGAPLVEAACPDEVASQDPIAVFSCNSASVVAVAKSILIDSGIEFGVAGENVQDLFGYGRFPAGASVFAGPVTLSVAPADARAATELLGHLGQDCDVEAEPGALDEDADDGPRRTWHSTARFVAKVVAAVMLGLVALEALVALAAALRW